MKLDIFYNERRITLQEIIEDNSNIIETIDLIDENEDEPFLHKCNSRLSNILEQFFANSLPKNIYFEHANLDRLFNDFKRQFKYIEAAGGLVINDKNELLVINRLDKNDLPKGKIEKGENPKIAAIREVEEECGITNLTITEKLKPSFHIYELKGKRVLKKTHWYKMSYTGNEKLIPQTEEDITKASWQSKNNVDKLLKNTYSSLEYLFEYFKSTK